MRPIYIVLIASLLGSSACSFLEDAKETLLDFQDKVEDTLGLKPGALRPNGKRPTTEMVTLNQMNVSPFGIREVEERIRTSLENAASTFDTILTAGKSAGLITHSLGAVKEVAEVAEKVFRVFEKFEKFTKFIPVAGDVIDIIVGFAELFEEETDWNKQIRETFNELMPEALMKNFIGETRSFMEFVNEKVSYINGTISSRKKLFKELETKMTNDPENCLWYLAQRSLAVHLTNNGENVASQLHTSLSNYMKRFTDVKSEYRRAPLTLAPLLIEMSLLVSVFEPLITELVAQSPEKLSCLVRDAINDFLPLIMEARFEKFRGRVNVSDTIVVRNLPYNKTGYSLGTNYTSCQPTAACDISALSVMLLNPDYCFADSSSNAAYKFKDDDFCPMQYTRLLRHSIEKMFGVPFEITDKLCNQTLEKASGYGWAMIKLKDLKAYHRDDPPIVPTPIHEGGVVHGDVTVRLYVDVELESTFTVEKYTKNVGEYLSRNISKTSTIDIIAFDEDKNLILKTSGKLDFFLKNPKVCTKELGEGQYGSIVKDPNCIIIDILWQDDKIPNDPETTDLKKEIADIMEKCPKKSQPQPQPQQPQQSQQPQQQHPQSHPQSQPQSRPQSQPPQQQQQQQQPQPQQQQQQQWQQQQQPHPHPQPNSFPKKGEEYVSKEESIRKNCEQTFEKSHVVSKVFYELCKRNGANMNGIRFS